MIRAGGAEELASLSWLDEGTREGLTVAADAGSGSGLVLVATEDSGASPIGVLAVDLPPWRGRTVPWLWLLEVRVDRRGRGIGTQLFTVARRHLAALGFPAVELSVDDTNVRAVALYERMGFVGSGSGTDPGDGGPQPWTRMRLELNRSDAQEEVDRHRDPAGHDEGP